VRLVIWPRSPSAGATGALLASLRVNRDDLDGAGAVDRA
jgi:hypothetical protein